MSAAGKYPAAASSFSITIPSTVSKVPGRIGLLFYGPKGYTKPAMHSGKAQQGTASEPRKGHPVIINFHGGGFTIGAANNDARWASAVLSAAKDRSGSDAPVFISVEYRRAPKYPHPISIEDGVDAVLWVWSHAVDYRLDASRVVLTGFSAGGNLSLTVALRLYEWRRGKDARPLTKTAMDGKLSGLIPFYPSVNYTRTRGERRALNKAPDKPAKEQIPESLYTLFDEAYLHPRGSLDMGSPYLSPGLSPDAMLKDALPKRIALFTCEWDQLYFEAEEFRVRLKALGKEVGGSMVKGVDHAWDKVPKFNKEDAKRDAMYTKAVEELRKMI